MIFVELPEQIDFARGKFVTTGVVMVNNWTVSITWHPPAFVTVTLYTPARPVVKVCDVPTVKPEPRSIHR
jgi:hypothetical protein